MPEKFDWAGQTTLHPLGVAALCVLAVGMLLLPRRYSALPMVLLVCLISARQRLVIASLDFSFLRLLMMVGWLRVLMRGETRAIRPRGLDLLVPLSLLSVLVASTLRTGSLSTLVFNLGVAFDGIGIYFLFRMLIRGWRDLRTVVTSFVLTSVPVALAFIVEASTGRNYFSIFGGVPEFTVVREERLRCQGPFSHPIVAGCFWAALMPMFVARWWDGGSGRLVAAVGASMGLLIIILCASTTPLGGVGAALLAAAFFPLRWRMRQVRWALVGILLALQLVMDSPVWHLISRVDAVGGSTGWHRYHLIDQAVRHFGEWALIGVNSTDHWGHLTGDLANQYVLMGVRGGLLSLVLFVASIVYAYKAVGVLTRHYRRHRARLIASWALGASVFAHTMMYLAVSQFGQVIFVWYLQLAILVSLKDVATREKLLARRARVRSGEPGAEADRPPTTAAGAPASREGGARRPAVPH